MDNCKTDILETGVKNLSYRVSSRLIKKSAVKAGAMGSITAIPAALPGLGTIGTAVIGISADMAYLIKTQIELCYAIAFAYEADIDAEELQAIVLALIGFSSANELVRDMTAVAVKNTVNETVKKSLAIGLQKASADIGERLATRTIRRAYKLLPFISIPVSASINIVSVMMVGNQARKYFLACDDR